MTALSTIREITARHRAAMAEAHDQVTHGWTATEVAAVWDDAMTVVHDLTLDLFDQHPQLFVMSTCLVDPTEHARHGYLLHCAADPDAGQPRDYLECQDCGATLPAVDGDVVQHHALPYRHHEGGWAA